MKAPILFVFLGIISAQPLVHASVISIPNSSFELPAVNVQDYSTPSNWTLTENVTGTGRTYNNSIKNPAVKPAGMDGAQFTAIYLDNNDSDALTPDLALSAALTSANLGTLTAETNYSLTAAFAGTNNGSPRTYGLAILANGVSVAEQTFNTNTLNGDGSFLDKTISFDTTAQPALVGQNLSVRLLYTSTYSFGRELFMDNVRLTAVPEPSAMAFIFGTATLLSVWLRRRVSK
ncbi:MAG: hypothetical protein SFY80_06920 [Verrucomicrobiota bacterium]|nr:hypothetical protein [Verrucomicrobiota bacterium]